MNDSLGFLLPSYLKDTVWEKQPLRFFNFSEKLQENEQKTDIFWAFKRKLRTIHVTIHTALFLFSFFGMSSTIYQYLSLLFSHFVFLFSSCVSFSFRQEKYSTIYNIWFDFITTCPQYYKDKKYFIVHDRRKSVALIITKLNARI